MYCNQGMVPTTSTRGHSKPWDIGAKLGGYNNYGDTNHPTFQSGSRSGYGAGPTYKVILCSKNLPDNKSFLVN